MSKAINSKCFECAKIPSHVFRRRRYKKPDCYVLRKCARKRSHYRNLEKDRKSMRDRHRYLKFCGSTCLLCKSERNLEVHHIIPQSRGGKDEWSNTVTLCEQCHMVITKYYRSIGWERQLMDNTGKVERC